MMTRFRLQNWVSVEERRKVGSGEFMEIDAGESEAGGFCWIFGHV